MKKKIFIVFFVCSFVLFWSSFASADFLDDLGDLWTVIMNIWLWIWAIVKFLVFWLKTLFNLVRKAFLYIFSPELFDWIWNVFSNLVLYMWGPSATAFVGLFFIAFLLVFMTFIFKLIKGQVSYKTALKKFEKQK